MKMNVSGSIVSIRGLLLAACAPAALVPATAFAQDQAPKAGEFAETEAPADEGGFDTIVVTAQKREESVQSVPVAISAFTGDALEAGQVTTTTDLAQLTPGLSFNTFQPGQPEISIRGVGTKEDGAGASDSTLVMVDGVYIAARSASNIDIFDLERVEILRGPQGTLFGKNAIGGVINYVTRKPDDLFRVRLRQTIGSYDQFDTAGVINMPLADNLFTKFSFSRRAFGGYDEWIIPGQDEQPWRTPAQSEQIGGDNLFAWRSQTLWEATDTLSVLLSLDGIDEELGNINRQPIGSAGPLHDCGCASDPIAVDIALGGADSVRTYLGEDDNGGERNAFGASLEVNNEFPFGTLTFSGAYRESDYYFTHDDTGLPPSPPVDLTGSNGNPNDLLLGDPSIGFTFDNSDIVWEDSTQFTGEVRLVSNPGRFNWLVGAFATSEEINRSEGILFTALADASLDPNFAIATMLFDGWAVAGFVQAGYELTDRLSITLGGRYSYEEKQIVAFNEIPTSPSLQLVLSAFPPTEGKESWGNFSWRAALDYEIADDVMLYGAVSTGFKSGGFTGSATTAVGATTPFEPEEATNYEIGLKGDFLDRRLRVNLSAFYLDYKDLQVTRFFQPQGSIAGEFITENAANAEIQGFEAEFTALLTDNLEIGGYYSYLDATFAKFFGTPDISGGGDFSGNTLRQAPEHSVGGHIQYEIDLGGDRGRLAANVSGAYQSLAYTNVDNNSLDVIPGYSVGDARLSWNSADDQWMVQAWVKNFTDEVYRTHVFTQRGGRIGFGTFAPPRTYGLTVQFSY
ncbi:MAG: iron complex outermembrane receptor protein [Kiritimatiellia bacterium]|jgi:iron complex outermembrane receptor protein|tara:strand:+ start:4619 stop:7009 length:2391 start_codon:yes stop_codon:yes gene_type:complete